VFSPDVITKAYGYVGDGKVFRSSPGVWEVHGTARYLVHTDADPETRSVTWASCSCPHGKQAPRKFPVCSHVAAVLAVVKHGVEVEGA